MLWSLLTAAAPRRAHFRCRKPLDAPTSERAIPVIIFSAEPAVARAFLRRWTGDAPGGDAQTAPDVREFIDWQYYRERISSAIQKIVTIPAAYQVRRGAARRAVPAACQCSRVSCVDIAVHRHGRHAAITTSTGRCRP